MSDVKRFRVFVSSPGDLLAAHAKARDIVRSNSRKNAASIILCSFRSVARKTIYEQLRRPLGEVFHKLAAQKECKIEEGHLLRDHVHMLISIPPKYAASQVVVYIKGKSAIHLALVYAERKQNFAGQYFWARGPWS